jgi:hypothetical protein
MAAGKARISRTPFAPGTDRGSDRITVGLWRGRDREKALAPRLQIDRIMRRSSSGRPMGRRWLAASVAAALAKIVLSSEVPTEPPTCWEVFTIAEATPASLPSTPKVADENVGAKMHPMPTPRTSRPGRTLLP